MQFLSFKTIDEFVELIETRFHNARVEIDDELMQHINDVYETNENAIQQIEFNVLHSFIETNLRQCVVRNYVREYQKHHENEFAHIYMFSRDNSFRHFDIVEIDDDDKINQLCVVHVNDNCELRVES
jgi:hypothetical protein